MMDTFHTSSITNKNIIIPEEIKVEPELVLIDDDDDDDGGDDEYNNYGNNNSVEYNEQGFCMPICPSEYEEYDPWIDGSEVVGNTETYMSYDEIQLHNELETSQNAVDEDVILIESDSDGNEGNSSDMKVLYECPLCFKTVG